ncbi:hypothetical protein FBR05_00295 [Deltaproteobacteria bacterium PRO3]|nr:hypothetical protein [Deltaproteobacteria bacterium PRO3]
MKTVKVTVKREQLQKVLNRVHPLWDEITLELPAEQVEMPRPAKGFPSICPGEHEFEEIEMGGMGKIKLCLICGAAREVKQESKRKRFKLHRWVESPYVGHDDVEVVEEVELEEVE